MLHENTKKLPSFIRGPPFWSNGGRVGFLNRVSDLALIYARIPRIACQRKCQASCGPILVHDIERARIEKITGHKLATEFWESLELTGEDLTCALLNAAGMCSIYQNRPVICRLWGVVKKMRCPFGCEPVRWLSDEEAYEIMKEIQDSG